MEWFFIHKYVGVVPQPKGFKYIVWEPGKQTIESECNYPDRTWNWRSHIVSHKLIEDICRRLQDEWLPGFLDRLHVRRIQEKAGVPSWECVKLGESEPLSENFKAYSAIPQPHIWSRAFKHIVDENQRVNAIRHHCTNYDARRHQIDYLSAFIEANTLIMQNCPELKAVAMAQIEAKRKLND